MIFQYRNKMIPELEISSVDTYIKKRFSQLIKESGVKDFSPEIQVWTSGSSNKALSYFSHGIFSYFGKFPIQLPDI